MRGNVLVLAGGPSPEREVSLASGTACREALGRAGFSTFFHDLSDGVAPLVRMLVDAPPLCVFNALHGTPGEDGTIQGLLDLLEVPYTHSGLRASALAIHKPTARDLFAAAGLPVAEGGVYPLRGLLDHEPVARPFVIKPCDQGSSVSVHIVDAGSNELGRIVQSDSLPDEVLVERYVPGLELTVGVLDGEPLTVTEIEPRTRFYDYREKYHADGARHILPARIGPDLFRLVCDIAVQAHALLGCRGVSRADFRHDPATGQLALLEINTQPGMTERSLVPEQALHCGMEFPELCARLVAQAGFGP